MIQCIVSGEIAGAHKNTHGNLARAKALCQTGSVKNPTKKICADFCLKTPNSSAIKNGAVILLEKETGGLL